jgi:hypothetical protein
MTSHSSHQPVSALRARMIEDMKVRGFSEKTRNDYIRNVRAHRPPHRLRPAIVKDRCGSSPAGYSLPDGWPLLPRN